MQPTTKDRILDSAELLFAQNGIAGTSLRALTDHAGVNLAAVNYHFQSKDALVQAVLFRRINPINQRRMDMLKTLLDNAGFTPPPLEAVLDAFYRPVVEAAYAARREGRPIMALLGRIYTEPGELLASQVRSMMADPMNAFLDAFHLAAPEIPSGVLFWRLHFSVGAISHTLGAMHLIEGLSRGRVRTDNPEEILHQLVNFAAAGLRGKIE